MQIYHGLETVATIFYKTTYTNIVSSNCLQSYDTNLQFRHLGRYIGRKSECIQFNKSFHFKTHTNPMKETFVKEGVRFKHKIEQICLKF